MAVAVLREHEHNVSKLRSKSGTSLRHPERRIGLFTSLPLDSLDRLSLQTKLGEIEKTEAALGEVSG